MEKTSYACRHEKKLIFAFILFLVGIAMWGNAYWNEKYEEGYAAFNSGDFADAREVLLPIARLGHPQAQRLMAYIYGLGLGVPVDVLEAMRWFEKSATLGDNSRELVSKQAYYMGKDAAGGLYGSEKVELGHLWLRIAYVSGAAHAISSYVHGSTRLRTQ